MRILKNRNWLTLVAVGLLAATLSGCGGDNGEAGPQGDRGPEGPAGPPGQTGNAGVSGTSVVNATFMTPEQWEAAKFAATISKVTISSPPVVEFSIIDEQGRPIEGIEKLTSRGSTGGQPNKLASYPNLAFAIAKLMPRTDSKPASWVSYIVTSVTNNATTGAVTGATRPSTDNQGTLEAVAGKPGSYKYTFLRDVPGTKAFIDGLTYTGNNRKDDLGDVTWQPTLPHRLTIQIGGAARGTGSNTPTGVQTDPAVNMANPVNLTYDFVPSTGQVLTAAELTREDVSIDNCNVCHQKLAFHGGSARVEVRYCVVCHTDQRAYGRAQVTSAKNTTTNGYDSITFPKLAETKTVDAITGITSYSYTPDTYVADGEVAGNFVTMIHKIHQGHTLVKQNYHYAGLAFNNKGFSKLGEGQKMCTTCHGGTAATTASNYREIPSRKSCGACHDGIKWDTGTGSTLSDKMDAAYAADASGVPTVLASSGHRGGAAQDDSSCKACHSADGIRLSHRTENITKNNPDITAGLASFRYEIKSARMVGADLVVDFGIFKKVSPSTAESLVTFVAPAASFPVLAPGVAGGSLQPDFSGGPSFMLPYALSQDGITTPADYNNLGRASAQPRTVSLTSCLTTSGTVSCTMVPSTTNPGYYTATILAAYPTGAKMRAVALQGYYSQVTAPASLTAVNGRHAISVIQPVAGDAVRRQIVDSNKCAGCHEWFEGHGGNRVYEIQVCTGCHVPGLATSGRGIPDSTLNTFRFNIAEEKILTDWGFNKTLPSAALKFPVVTQNLKDMIHGIHAGRDRVSGIQIARDATSRGVINLLDFRRMDFPGKLNSCEGCHVTATGSATTYNTIPTGALSSTYESINATYAANILAGTAIPADAKASLSAANNTDIVSTPWAGACVSCHDGSPAKAHIAINGGQLNVTRLAALPAGRALEDVESCAVCHGPGRDFDTAKVHK